MDDDKSLDKTFYPSENPGAHERHLLRRQQNPLFGSRASEVNSDTLQHCQKVDHDILQQFMHDFRQVMSQAVALNANEDSEVILAIKEKLDKLYAASVSVADDQRRVQAAIKKLLGVVMQAVKNGAAEDPRALQELAQEEAAREAHFAFLVSPLVADILDLDSPIENDDLLPTLLSAESDDLRLAIQLFDEQQLQFFLQQGKHLLDTLDSQGENIEHAAENYVLMEGYLHFLRR